MNIFDILGPIMVGPSSSHTAGAVRIGKVARMLLGAEPKHARITLHGSFAATGSGHGTDKALIAGLLGMDPDDMRIPDSEVIAEKQGLEYQFHTKNIRGAHPNTAVIQVDDGNGKQVHLQASSIGGGRIRVNGIDGIQVDFSAESPTLIVNNEDRPGHVAAVTSILAEADINIATLTLNRGKRGGKAIFVTETDLDIPRSVVEKISRIPGVLKVTYLNV
ncbi:MAG: L-serine ammonia-lyase, iron-sulfur-dependent subunit beta [Lachnospiraceae bacterium]|nr:L-serine ammonia-lyase, iron-sulfur-dependent, subunit beta [Candidatus Fimimorpha excrementavium]